jgi:hypothetical protein
MISHELQALWIGLSWSGQTSNSGTIILMVINVAAQNIEPCK